MNSYVLTVNGIDCPAWRIDGSDVLDEHITAIRKADQSRTRVRKSLFQFGLPPDRATAVDRAAPGDGDVVQVIATNEGRMRILMHSLPATINDRIIFRIFAAKNHCPSIQMKRNIASQE